MMRGLFVAEGSSDLPLAALVEASFATHQCGIRLTSPDYERLPERVRVDVRSKVTAGMTLMGADDPIDAVVVHRDADRAGIADRTCEIAGAIEGLVPAGRCVPVIPVRMTEAWLLLDEPAIRVVAGNSNGKVPLDLPKLSDVERIPDPKAVLARALLDAADETGRRRDRVRRRFGQHRKQLLERLDPDGPVQTLESWQQLQANIKSVAQVLLASSRVGGRPGR